MEVFESQIHQVFVKLLDGKHRILNFDAPSISVSALKHRIQTLTAIPSHLQLLLVNNSRVLHDHGTLTIAQSRGNPQFSEPRCPDSNSQSASDQDLIGFRLSDVADNLVGLGKFPVVVHLLLRLRGGKGGFGSLLRGAAPKAGQKKTNNFDACRDLSGRRLRHVNAEKKLEEWRAEEEERKLEKVAEEFIKKKTKGKGGDSAEKYVAKYREDSAKCMENVDKSVRESIKGLISSKRKSQAEGSGPATKRLKIWVGKRKMSDSDSEDLDEDGADEEKEKLDSGSVDQGSSENGSEEENTEESLKSVKSLNVCSEDGNVKNRDSPALESPEETKDYTEVIPQVPDKSLSSTVNEVVSQQPATCGPDVELGSAADAKDDSSKSNSVVEESLCVSESLENVNKPLNFDDYLSAGELEVLGLERLKSELQTRGLKCGGTLQERAARLFLLKTTPFEMLPKKLLAKK